MPEVTAEKGTNWHAVSAAMMRASVVLPVPGGPQKMSDGTRSWAIARRRNPRSPTTACWPTISSSVRGRRRSASGVPASGFDASGCPESPDRRTARATLADRYTIARTIDSVNSVVEALPPRSRVRIF
jgi:hypothetical protein